MTTDKRGHQNDPWLGAFCSENACPREEESLLVVSSQKDQPAGDSAWLVIFCSEDRCQAETPIHVV